MTVIEAIRALSESVQRLDRQVSQMQAGATARSAPVGNGMNASPPSSSMERPLGRLSEMRMRAQYEAFERTLSALGRKSARELSAEDLDVVCNAMSAASARVREAEDRRDQRRFPRRAAARARLKAITA